jgi:lysophospholipase L1-like esterase
MKKIILSIAIICLSACSNKMNELPQNAKIVAFGDSLTYGYGAIPEQSYPAKLEKIINRKVINSGVNGNTTKDGLDRVESIIEMNPSLVILGLGGNDMLQKKSTTETIKNLKEIIEKLKQKNINVVLLAVPKPSVFGLVSGLSDADFYEKIAKEEKIELISSYSKHLSKEENKSDPIHLNAIGYNLVAEDIAQKFKSFGLIRK